jgi:biotin carboxylase
LCFNVELFWDEARDRVTIIEINPRLAGQFGDLYLAVDGASSYEHLLAVAAGEPVRPPPRGAGRVACAASVPLRVFEPVRVLSVPGERELARLRAEHPDARVWIEAREGQELADFTSFQDGASHRYAVVNLGADSRAALERRLQAVQRLLGFRLEPLRAPTPAR